MKLIVGLGNPGRKYVGTRHNIGWEVLAELARRHAVGSPRSKFQGEIVESEIAGDKVLLLCPLTYMNCSGASVQPARDFYRLDNQGLIVVCDDFNLPLAKLRFRGKGSSGGQKGLQDIIRRLGTEEFARLRIGIGSPPPRWNVTDFVLARFTKEEQAEIEPAVSLAATALADWVERGIEYCMNQYNSN
jgi:PTH1 family peptidyl-tRNA hydrolase